MAARGYPGEFARGSEVKGLAEAASVPGVTIFHGGTRATDDGRILAVGGRVLTVSATGASLEAARSAAYVALSRIEWRDGFYRRDIGWRGLAVARSA